VLLISDQRMYLVESSSTVTTMPAGQAKRSRTSTCQQPKDAVAQRPHSDPFPVDGIRHPHVTLGRHATVGDAFAVVASAGRRPGGTVWQSVFGLIRATAPQSRAD